VRTETIRIRLLPDLQPIPGSVSNDLEWTGGPGTVSFIFFFLSFFLICVDRQFLASWEFLISYVNELMTPTLLSLLSDVLLLEVFYTLNISRNVNATISSPVWVEFGCSMTLDLIQLTTGDGKVQSTVDPLTGFQV